MKKGETKFNNETYSFIESLNPKGTFQDIARTLDVTYVALYLSFKKNRISHPMMKKIESKFNLSVEQKNILNNLVLK